MPDTNNNNETETLINAWKEIIQVQMHFNEIEMKIRSIAITTIIAIVGAIGFLLKEDVKNQEEFIVLLIFVGIFAWIAFYMMDKYWYHNLLNGAVKAGVLAEKKIKEMNLPIELGSSIYKESPNKILFTKNLEVHSAQKLTFFYLYIPLLCISTILTFKNTHNLYYTFTLNAFLVYFTLLVLGLEHHLTEYRDICKNCHLLKIAHFTVKWLYPIFFINILLYFLSNIIDLTTHF